MKTSELVTVATFPSVAQAQVAQGVLEEVGIESLIQSDNEGGMYPALDAAALLVRSENLEGGTGSSESAASEIARRWRSAPALLGGLCGLREITPFVSVSPFLRVNPFPPCPPDPEPVQASARS